MNEEGQMTSPDGLSSDYPADFKSGFVAILGAPNVGKSTLLNCILKEKISITSKKPQTTRNRILGVHHRETSQIVFIDTPGIHNSKKMLNARMVEAAISAASDVDILLFMVDVDKPDPASENIVVKNIRKAKKPVVLALNKIDLIGKKESLLTVIDSWKEKGSFEAIVPISAEKGEQIDDLLNVLEKFLPYGPPYYPEDSLTDLSTRFIVSEIIREKAFRFCGQEIPYSIAVTVDVFKARDSGLIDISAAIHVERESQKGIIIGKGGDKLKQIGENARKEIELLVDAKVFLKLFVRVQKNWSNDPRALRRFGYV